MDDSAKDFEVSKMINYTLLYSILLKNNFTNVRFIKKSVLKSVLEINYIRINANLC